MADMVLDVSMSLDGFIAQADDDPGPLHEWIFRDTDTRSVRRGGGVFAKDPVLEESFETTGAVLIGRHTFDVAEEPWGDDPPFEVPVLVLTHEVRDPVVKGSTTFTFVTDGLEDAVERAKAAAGEKNVGVMGASLAQQLLKAGLLDEMQIHLIPILFGDGVRLFEPFDTGHVELELTRLIESPGVTHLRFRIAK